MNALLTGSHLLSEAADVIKWKNLGNVPVPVQNFNTLNEIQGQPRVALKTLELYHFHLICMCVYINILNSLCVCVVLSQLYTSISSAHHCCLLYDCSQLWDFINIILITVTPAVAGLSNAYAKMKNTKVKLCSGFKIQPAYIRGTV